MSEMEKKECCCANDAGKLAKVDAIIEKHGDKPGALIPVLHEIQREIKYLPEAVLARVAEKLDLPFSQVYGVATFYSLFTVEPKGEYIIRVCESAPCHIRGAQAIVDALEEALGIKMGEKTPDGKFSLEFSSCLGVCGVAPAIMINDEVYGNLTPAMIPEILQKCK